MALEYFEDQPRRLTGDGKHSLERIVNGTNIIVKCLGCKWSYSTLTFFEDEAEHAGWMHISNPTLAISGSSDIHRAARMARAVRDRHPVFKAMGLR